MTEKEKVRLLAGLTQNNDNKADGIVIFIHFTIPTSKIQFFDRLRHLHRQAESLAAETEAANRHDIWVNHFLIRPAHREVVP